MTSNLLETWVNQHTDALYSWAFHKVSDSELAKDLVQDTFLAAAEKMENFKGDSSPKTWLFSILNHKIIDHYRKKVHQPLALENQSDSIYLNQFSFISRAMKKDSVSRAVRVAILVGIILCRQLQTSA